MQHEASLGFKSGYLCFRVVGYEAFARRDFVECKFILAGGSSRHANKFSSSYLLVGLECIGNSLWFLTRSNVEQSTPYLPKGRCSSRYLTIRTHNLAATGLIGHYRTKRSVLTLSLYCCVKAISSASMSGRVRDLLPKGSPDIK